MKSYSQYKQDITLYRKYFSNKKDGFFLELGADDGVDKSNTKFFEDLGWTGICIEPSPERFKQLTKNRNCICINKAVTLKVGRVEFIDIVGYGKGLSGVVDQYDSEHLKRIEKETISAKTISKKKINVDSEPLSKILEDNKVTRINYCSIDVEGSEKEVLSSIDFGKVEIDVISVEDNYDDKELKNLIKELGYHVVMKIGPDLICTKKTMNIFSKFF